LSPMRITKAELRLVTSATVGERFARTPEDAGWKRFRDKPALPEWRGGENSVRWSVGLCFSGLAEVRLTGTHTKVYATVPGVEEF